jgi:glycosyltransferase involved in cell wall biosynthesis
MTRIAIYLHDLGGGGAQRVMVILANALAERGILVDLLVSSYAGPFVNQVSKMVRVVNLNSARVAASLPGLVRYLRRERPNALLSSLDHANVVALVAQVLAGSPGRMVVGVHNTVSQSRPKTLRDRLLPILTRITYPLADCIVAVSQGVADDVVRFIGVESKKVRVIYNPVVTPTLKAYVGESLDHPWFACGEPPVVLGVGRLTEQKDFQTLIHAFAKLRSKRMARLMILGDGELRPDLEGVVRMLGLSRDVALPGFVANPFAYMGRSAVFVLSSRYEGLPTVLIEAMACSTPVVATDCPSGPREILEGGKWGRLVPVGDPASLSHAIGAALDEPEHPNVSMRAMDFGIEQSVAGYLAALAE